MLNGQISNEVDTMFRGDRLDVAPVCGLEQQPHDPFAHLGLCKLRRLFRAGFGV